MIRKIAIIIGAYTWLLSASAMATPDKDSDYQPLSLFNDVLERIRVGYVEKTNDKELLEAALNGMLTSLDPHSSYLNTKKFNNMKAQNKGEFGGLGIEVTMESGLIKIISPIDDTPAFKAGLRPNDFITHLDGESVQGLNINEVVDRMRGSVNTNIKLTVSRNKQELFEVTLTRAIIKIQTVKYKLQDNVGYIRISQFVESTDTNLRKAIDQLKKDSNGNLQGFILDLRNNPGGLLDQAINVSSDFLDKGEVVSTRSRRPEETKHYASNGKDLIDGLPLVVLINDGSASASEIVAGALQDHRRAILLGTKSFGKGSVQTIIPLKDHDAMVLTTARYYTPLGRSIQAVGIEPDIKVLPYNDESLNLISDHFNRSEASLPRALKNNTNLTSTESDNKSKVDNKDKIDNKAKVEKVLQNNTTLPLVPSSLTDDGTKMLDLVTDCQLARAMDLVHGLSFYKYTIKR
ncbi:MAG: S41 family peptidase [Rhodospirillaceae bacterium]|jgi:carboxyl-terminal processing protease|nr:S41 family peptidase [Rhodospirillaceae bacterium]